MFFVSPQFVVFEVPLDCFSDSLFKGGFRFPVLTVFWIMRLYSPVPRLGFSVMKLENVALLIFCL